MLARRRLVRFVALAAFIALVAFSLWLADVGNVAVVVPVMVLAYLIAATYELLAWRSDAFVADREPARPGARMLETAVPEPASAELPPEPGAPLPEPGVPGPPSPERDPLPPEPGPAPPEGEPDPEPQPELTPDPMPEPQPEPEPEPTPEAPPRQEGAPPRQEGAPPTVSRPRRRFSIRKRPSESPAPDGGDEPAEQKPAAVEAPRRRERPRLVPALPREPVATAPTEAPATNVAQLRRRSEPREWNVWELQRLARDATRREPSRAEEWSYLFVHLRGFAGPDGALPREFDGLVRESFGELLEPLESA